MTLADRCRKIELLVVDVDGVLSDGGITYGDNRTEIKRFHVRDGSGIKIWQRCGKNLAFLSGRQSECTGIRAAELAIEIVLQGSAVKVPGFLQILRTSGVEPEQTGFVGDDLPDLPIFNNCGLAVAVADACPELLRQAHYVTRVPGGHGAIREVIELILRCQGLWQPALTRLYGGPGG